MTDEITTYERRLASLRRDVFTILGGVRYACEGDTRQSRRRVFIETLTPDARWAVASKAYDRASKAFTTTGDNSKWLAWSLLASLYDTRILGRS